MRGPASILVVRWGRLGDLLLTAAATREMKRAWPEARIDLAVMEEYAEAATLLPGIDRIVPFARGRGVVDFFRGRGDLRGPYDLAFDLHGNLRARALLAVVRPRRVFRYERLVRERRRLVRTKKGKGGDFPPVWRRYVGAVARAGADVLDDPPALALPEGAGGEGAIAFAPGAGRPTKRWPAARFAEAARLLAGEGRPILLVGAAAERPLLEEIARESGANPEILAGAPIPETAARLRNASVLLTNDSGLMHLAAGAGTSVVALFGPTVPELGFPPAGEGHMVLSRNLPCRPCSLHGGDVCPLPDRSHACLVDIPAEEAAGAARAILRDSPPALGYHGRTSIAKEESGLDG
ncbi:MAG: glycosyltransferase family 9 protein [Candidatus Eisenbacteria bacterium]